MLLHTTLLLASASLVLGHGRVTQPPSRASAWRLGFPTPANYDDDGLNCGGYAMQWSGNGGKCGICGDAYNIPTPRPNELGGTYGLGIIVAKYLPGATIATTTQLTASHMGYWEFKLCPDPTDNSQACFDKHLLVSEDGETKYTPTRGSGIYKVNYKLPAGLICEHCVLQWRYVAGNNWGVCSNGTSGLGCGNQEEFRACSDIAIGVSKTLSSEGNIPSALLFYLQKGYFELDQGYLISQDPKRPTAPQRPTRPRPSNRQPKINQPQRQQLNQQSPTSNQQSQLLNRQPQTFIQPSKQQFQPSNQQTLNKHFQSSNNPPNRLPQTLKEHPQLPHVHTQPSNHQQPLSNQQPPSKLQSQQSYQPQPSNHQQPLSNQQPPSKLQSQQSYQPQPSNHQQPLSNQQPPSKLQSQQSHQPQPSYQQPRPSNQQPHHSNPQPSTRQLQPSNQPPHHSNQQPYPSKRPQSKQQKTSKRKHKSSKRHLKSLKHQPSPLRYEYKTSDQRKKKQAKSKKKKQARGNHRGKPNTTSQRYNYL